MQNNKQLSLTIAWVNTRIMFNSGSIPCCFNVQMHDLLNTRFFPTFEPRPLFSSVQTVICGHICAHTHKMKACVFFTPKSHNVMHSSLHSRLQKGYKCVHAHHILDNTGVSAQCPTFTHDCAHKADFMFNFWTRPKTRHVFEESSVSELSPIASLEWILHGNLNQSDQLISVWKFKLILNETTHCA